MISHQNPYDIQHKRLLERIENNIKRTNDTLSIAVEKLKIIFENSCIPTKHARILQTYTENMAFYLDNHLGVNKISK